MTGPCPSGKKRYPEENVARDVLLKIKIGHAFGKIHRRRRCEYRYYQCPDCKGYHLTSQREYPQQKAAP